MTIKINNENIKVIHLKEFLKKSTFNLGDLISSIKTIPLETTNESLISEIEYILVTQSYIYIQDAFQGSSILVFDNNGKFIKRIIRGQAPENLFKVNNFVFDNKKEELIVYNTPYLSFYSPEGDFKRKARVPLSAYSFGLTKNGYVFHAVNGNDNRHFTSNKNNQILITDTLFKLKSTGFPNWLSKENFRHGKSSYFNNVNDSMLISFNYNDTIFQYNNDYKISAKYVLDFDKHKLPADLLKGNYSTLLSELESNNYYFFMGEFVENGTHEFFRLSNHYHKYFTNIYRDKNTGKMYGGTNIAIDRAFYPNINYTYSSYENSFVSYISNDDYIKLLTNKYLSVEMTNKLKSLKADDNPSIILYELKKFD
ncbi:MAG: 6-bladed beta-propeller [Paludibacter sp.]|nr:6-bladed beta-propeller [Paludibacter sp.]